MDNLYKLCDDELWQKLSDKKGGVYKIVAVKDGEIVPQHRFLGIDTDGILYIGKATSYIDRVIGLVKSISPKYKGSSHICGRRYKSNPNIAEQFPFDTLHLDIIQSSEPEVIEKINCSKNILTSLEKHHHSMLTIDLAAGNKKYRQKRGRRIYPYLHIVIIFIRA